MARWLLESSGTTVKKYYDRSIFYQQLEKGVCGTLFY